MESKVEVSSALGCGSWLSGVFTPKYHAVDLLLREIDIYSTVFRYLDVSTTIQVSFARDLYYSDLLLL